MKSKKTIICGLFIFVVIVLTNYMCINITKFFTAMEKEKDYQNLGLEIEDYNIEYCTIYGYARFSEYKVYKIKNYYNDSMEKYKKQLENSNLWDKNKFYEYIMMEFYEIKENETVDIDRENLFYYNQNDVYAIFDIKNAKLYYFKKGIFDNHKNYSNILGIEIDNYIDKEVYSIRGGPQNDGTDYYTYEFTKEKGDNLEKLLEENGSWTKEKLDKNIIDCFEYNEEVNSIENGYYYYKRICRTSDERKKYNFTDEEATGYEVGIYNIDTNKLYYYWTSI